MEERAALSLQARCSDERGYRTAMAGVPWVAAGIASPVEPWKSGGEGEMRLGFDPVPILLELELIWPVDSTGRSRSTRSSGRLLALNPAK